MHKLIHDLAPLNTAVDEVNTVWPDYDEVCVETKGLSIVDHDSHDVPTTLVLRGHLRCCCSGPCPYRAEHDRSKDFAKSLRGILIKNNEIAVDHNPGQEYVESILALSDLLPLRADAAQRAPDPEQRKVLSAEIAAEATQFELTAGDIESQLGLTSKGGFLSASGAADAVLAGGDASPDDYFWVAAFVILWQRFLTNAHTKLSRDWPQRGRVRAATFQQR